MHKIFGEKRNDEYVDRKGAYIIPFKGNKVGVVKTYRGYFLLGGGIEDGETDEMCIVRECLEEIGYDVEIKKFVCSAETYGSHLDIEYFHPIQTYYLGEVLEQKQAPIEKDHEFVWIEYDELIGKIRWEMQGWAIEQCWNAK